MVSGSLCFGLAFQKIIFPCGKLARSRERLPRPDRSGELVGVGGSSELVRVGGSAFGDGAADEELSETAAEQR